ncbi:hypothetical protein [Yeosuana sp. AK3]
MKFPVLDMKRFSLLLLIFYGSFSFSQIKNEKEERINASDFPEVLQSYFNTISNQVNHLKFYKETDGKKYSYEAKFKFKKHLYSVEFDANGVLEDIEMVIKKKQIPKEAMLVISNYFNTHYDKTHLIKIQKQYKNNTTHSDQQFIDNVLSNAISDHSYFEIVAETKQHGERQLQELIFKNDGTFVNARLVTISSYGHVLY